MRSMTRMAASAALGGLVLLVLPVPAVAQAPQVQAITHVASMAPGSILGTVQDEKGAPVAGAMVSAMVPFNKIDDIAALSTVQFASPSYSAHLEGVC